MKFTSAVVIAAMMVGSLTSTHAATVKMCNHFVPSGHVRTDPIISQDCVSDHIHTFYGPQQFRPETTEQDLLDTPSAFSSTQIEENKSLYWHPTIYQYYPGTGTYTKATINMSSGYYRWDDSQDTMEFPQGFRMIAGLNPTVQGLELFSECNGSHPCERTDSCKSESTFFPHTACGEMGIALQFPTCWNGQLDDPDDHMSHMAYTSDGTVQGECPPTHQAGRFPQIQLFVRIANYPGGWYRFSDDTDIFHADFMNGWEEGSLQRMIDGCQPFPGFGDDFNPPCGCEEFVTPKAEVMTSGIGDDSKDAAELLASQPCPMDTRRHVVDEEVDFLISLPRGTCIGTVEPRSVTDPFVPECVKVPLPVSPPEGEWNSMLQNGVSSEDVSSEDVSSEDVSNAAISNAAVSSEDVSSEEDSSEEGDDDFRGDFDDDDSWWS